MCFKTELWSSEVPTDNKATSPKRFHSFIHSSRQFLLNTSTCRHCPRCRGRAGEPPGKPPGKQWLHAGVCHRGPWLREDTVPASLSLSLVSFSRLCLLRSRSGYIRDPTLARCVWIRTLEFENEVPSVTCYLKGCQDGFVFFSLRNQILLLQSNQVTNY